MRLDIEMDLQSIDSHALILLYQESCAERGAAAGTCDPARLDAALAYPLSRAAAGGADIAAIAAAYAVGILAYAPFAGSNVGAALLALELFLARNGWSLLASPEEALNMLRSIEVGSAGEQPLANWLRVRL